MFALSGSEGVVIERTSWDFECDFKVHICCIEEIRSGYFTGLSHLVDTRFIL